MAEIVITAHENHMPWAATMSFRILLVLALSLLAGCDTCAVREYRVVSDATIGTERGDYIEVLRIVESAPVPMTRITNYTASCLIEYGEKGIDTPLDIRCSVMAVSNTVMARLAQFNGPGAKFRSFDAHIRQECQQTFSNRFTVIRE